MGKVRVARNKGEQMKPGILLDGEGKPTTDPGVDVPATARGAVLTFGEHKGYALAFVCEMLAGALCRQRHDAARAAGPRHGDQRHADRSSSTRRG